MIGIIPAAGTAERFYGLPKFMLPCADGISLFRRLERLMHSVGYLPIVTVTRVEQGKVVKDHLRRPVRYINSSTMTETILSQKKLIGDRNVLFGMPDTYFEDEQAFVKLIAALEDGADVAVGVFKARPGQHTQGGMCEIVNDRVVSVIDKPAMMPLKHYEWIWGVLAWKPVFWQFLKPEMPHVGYGLMPAIEYSPDDDPTGLDVRAVKLDGNYYDCGTPERYFEMIRATTGEVVTA